MSIDSGHIKTENFHNNMIFNDVIS
jgi:hypothetical protein